MAQLGGEPRKVKLTVDLTKYDSKLTVGQVGYTIPNTQLSMWGSFDNFVAVDFECGTKMDIAYNSLEFESK